MVATPISKIHELESIYEHAPLGLAVFDKQLRFVRLNQQIADMNGIPLEAHAGRTLRELMPGIADKIEPMLQRVLDTGEPIIDYEVVGKTPATRGETRIWVESYFPMHDDAGAIVGVNAIVEDITEQRRYEEALQRSEELTRRIIESTKDCLKVLDLQGHLLSMNEKGMRAGNR